MLSSTAVLISLHVN